jgi:hypothetical protein
MYSSGAVLTSALDIPKLFGNVFDIVTGNKEATLANVFSNLPVGSGEASVCGTFGGGGVGTAVASKRCFPSSWITRDRSLLSVLGTASRNNQLRLRTGIPRETSCSWFGLAPPGVVAA